ncbi:MAG: cytochrome c3 family protein [Candidatus Tectomicrobia bacterium]|nr:cytochrome c3 family protein [Candidatus Tectomicrobia bacterium]
MKYLVIGSLLVVILVVVVLIISGKETIFMNGPLAFSHESIESRCRECHAPWSITTNEKCTFCHLQATADAIHEALDLTCASCHREHQGKEFNLNVVKEEKCVACHADVVIQKPHPGSGTQCFECHKQHFAIPVASIPSFSDLRFPHDWQVHTVGKQREECGYCHQSANDRVRMTTPLGLDGCAGCHPEIGTHDKTKDKKLEDCAGCHGKEERRVKSRVIKFNSTLFSHRDHANFGCVECHTEQERFANLADIVLPAMETCARCH